MSGFFDARTAMLLQSLVLEGHPEYADLPHPKRIALSRMFDVMGEMLREEWEPLCDVLRRQDKRMEEIVNIIIQWPRCRDYLMAMFGVQAGDNFGNAEGVLTAFRHRLTGGVIFQTRDSLDEALCHTDIGADAPCSFFRLPYPSVYVELGDTRSSPYRIHNAVSGSHVLEGAYLTETRLVPSIGNNCSAHSGKIGIRDGEEIRVIDVVLIGSPVGKSDGFLDDAFRTISVPIADENAPLSSWIERLLEHDDRFIDRSLLTPLDANGREEFMQCIPHLAKVLLYLNSADAKKEVSAEFSDLRARLERTGQAKRGKIERRMDRVYDRIVVGPSGAAALKAPEDEGDGVATHWRRGHFRMQAHGPAMSLRKVLWIEPVLVAAARLGAGDVSRKRYTLR